MLRRGGRGSSRYESLGEAASALAERMTETKREVSNIAYRRESDLAVDPVGRRIGEIRIQHATREFLRQ